MFDPMPPKDPLEPVIVKMPSKLHQKFREVTVKRKTTMADVIRVLVKKYLDDAEREVVC